MPAPTIKMSKEAVCSEFVMFQFAQLRVVAQTFGNRVMQFQSQTIHPLFLSAIHLEKLY